MRRAIHSRNIGRIKRTWSARDRPLSRRPLSRLSGPDDANVTVSPPVELRFLAHCTRIVRCASARVRGSLRRGASGALSVLGAGLFSRARERRVIGVDCNASAGEAVRALSVRGRTGELEGERARDNVADQTPDQAPRLAQGEHGRDGAQTCRILRAVSIPRQRQIAQDARGQTVCGPSAVLARRFGGRSGGDCPFKGRSRVRG
jgi:hypothetical protein